jgi:serine protease
MSLGGGKSQAVDDAVKAAIDSGVTFVVAGGNDSNNACDYSPAGVPEAVTVGASDSLDYAAGFSNWGPCLDLYAPGQGVWSATNTADTDYRFASGTSMASPHVAGAAALYLQTHPTAAPAEVASYIVSGATRDLLRYYVYMPPSAGTPNALLRTYFGPPPPKPPIASFTWKCTRRVCSFDASASSDDSGIKNYTWTFGDATPVVVTTSALTSHTYKKGGNYNVTLTVTDMTDKTTSKVIRIKA